MEVYLKGSGTFTCMRWMNQRTEERNHVRNVTNNIEGTNSPAGNWQAWYWCCTAVLGIAEDEPPVLPANPICLDMANRSSLPPLSMSPIISPDASGDEAPHEACRYPTALVLDTPTPCANNPSDDPAVLPDEDEELACCSYWQALPPTAMG